MNKLVVYMEQMPEMSPFYVLLEGVPDTQTSKRENGRTIDILRVVQDVTLGFQNQPTRSCGTDCLQPMFLILEENRSIPREGSLFIL